eukprot:1862325-Amphidinium_carterae.1
MAGLRDYVITENGARALNLKDGSSLYELWLDGPDAATPLRQLRKAMPEKCFFVQVTKDGGLIEAQHPWLQDEVQGPAAMKLFTPVSGDLLDVLTSGCHCAKSYVTVQGAENFDAEMSSMSSVIGAGFKLRAVNQLLPGISNTCEIQSIEVNKADAVAGLCEELGLSMQDVWAFGDDHNDVRMLQEAGWGVTMANATPAMSEVGKDSTEHTNDEDGVAKYLEEHLFA